MLGHMSAQDKICSDIYQNDKILVKICTVALYFCLDICQIKVGFVQVNTKGVGKMSDVRLLFTSKYKILTFVCAINWSSFYRHQPVYILYHQK